MTVAAMVGVLAAAGTYLVLQRGLVRMALGFVLLSHAVNVLLVASGGLGRRGVPIEGAAGTAADPLPQAFTLTAIVIGFGMTAFLLALAFRAQRELGDDDLEDVGPSRRDDPEAGDGEKGDGERTDDDGGAGDGDGWRRVRDDREDEP